MFELEQIFYSNFIWAILSNVMLFITALLFLLGYFLSKDARTDKYLREFGGPPALPLVGNALSLMGPHENIIPVVTEWVKQYGASFRAWIGNAPYVFLGTPHDVEKILSSPIHINKGSDYEMLFETWLSTGLLTAKREKWFHRRKLLTPTFHFKILEDFMPIFNEQSKIMNILLEKQRRISDTFDITTFISKCTLDVICETAMGEKINAQIGGEADYVKMVCGMTDIIMRKGLNPIYRLPYVWNVVGLGRTESKYLKTLHGFTDKIIADRKMKRNRKQHLPSTREAVEGTLENWDAVETGVKTRKAFLDLLLDLQESENKFTDADIREEVDTFMFEGHDTTGANLSWVCLMMACNPDCQKKVHEELDAVFSDDPDRDITTADLKQLKYLECCVKETLRLYPSVPFFLRRAEQDIPLDDKRIIPKGTTINISPVFLHRYPEIFPDPEKFDPMRFTPENSIGRHPYSYVPFSAGPRNCIGQKFALIEEKIIVATLLRKFRLEAVDTTETVVVVPEIVLRPKNGIRVRLINRIEESK